MATTTGCTFLNMIGACDVTYSPCVLDEAWLLPSPSNMEVACADPKLQDDAGPRGTPAGRLPELLDPLTQEGFPP